MIIKVTSIIMLDTEKIKTINKAVKVAIEREASNPGSDRIGRLWAWDEANRQDNPDIFLKIIP
uniref:Uncharacterized protein n=1 Tax=viral metagenome TaxID=1070528 RepID=A0A6M3K0W9_9ZZZZ